MNIILDVLYASLTLGILYLFGVYMDWADQLGIKTLKCGCKLNFDREEVFPDESCQYEHSVIGGDIPTFVTTPREKSEEK